MNTFTEIDRLSMQVYSIGHSTRTADEFQRLLGHYVIELLVDVRTVPKSRHVPHFNSDALRRSLQTRGIGYRHYKKLGGLRKPVKDSGNLGWRNASFRGYADYMQTDEFWEALRDVIELAKKTKVALMCAEAVPWRCHRSLIADALVVGKWEVFHILSETQLRRHELTPFGVVKSGRIIYPRAG
jgi:uncharacterized protein (DUF488 family)